MNLDRPNIVSDDIAKIWPPNSRFTCPKKAVLLTSSFQAVLLFFADSSRKKDFQPMKSLDFCLGQQKKYRSKRTVKKNRFFGTCKRLNDGKLQLLNNVLRPVGEAAMAFDYKKCCNAKGQRFRYLSKTHFRTYLWLLYSESRKGLYCKYCATFTTSSVKCSVGKNCQKPGKLVIAPVCSF